jgi:membrane-bound inhibitor of C-type lysozyme
MLQRRFPFQVAHEPGTKKAMRIKLAAALLFTAVASLAGTSVQAAQVQTVRYACQPRQDFVVESDRKVALVRFEDRTYELKRKASDIGIKYVSPTATLIIDGPSAIFVAEDRLQLGACNEMLPIAEERL